MKPEEGKANIVEIVETLTTWVLQFAIGIIGFAVFKWAVHYISQ